MDIQKAEKGPQEAQRLEVLLKEYELSKARIEGFDNRFLQLFSLAFLILSAIATYLLSANPPPAIVWFAPFVGILFCTFFVFELYYATASIFNGRMLTEQINKKMEEVDLVSLEPNMPEALFFSSQRGHLKARLTYFLLFGGGVFLLLLVMGIALRLIYSSNHLSGTLFVVIYGPFFALFMFAATGILIDLPNLYRSFRQHEQESGHLQHPGPLLKTASKLFTLQKALAWIIPRPRDVFFKEVFVFYGFMTAWLSVGVQPEQLPLLNFLFREDTDWRSVSEVPGWAVIGLGVIYFLVAGLLLQQAKLLWDDIRDIGRDRQVLHNKRRALASGFMTPKAAIWQVVLRWGLALVLGYLLGGWVLLFLFLAISLHQAVYELWGKPRGKDFPLVLAFFVSLSDPLRFLVGVMAVVGSHWSWAPLVLPLILCYFWKFGAVVVFWHLEAQHYQNVRPWIRPQSPYYLDHGEHWHHVGLVAAIIAGSLLVAIQWLTGSCHGLLPILAEWYVQCPAANTLIPYVEFNPLQSFALTAGGIIAITFIAWLCVKISRTLGRGRVAPTLQTLNIHGAFPFCVLMAVIFFVLAFLHWDVTFLFWAFLFLNIGYLFLYQSMTYEQYTLENLRKLLPLLVAAGYAYLFRSIPGWSFSQFKKTLGANDEKMKALCLLAHKAQKLGLSWCVYGEAAVSAYQLLPYVPAANTTYHPILVFLGTDKTAVVENLFQTEKLYGNYLKLPFLDVCWNKLDLEVNGRHYKRVFDQALQERISLRVIAGIPAPVIPLEDLLIMKAVLQRDQAAQNQIPAIDDVEDIRVLVNTLKDDLDMEYLRKQATASQEFQRVSQCLSNFGIKL